jgi:hypothetical protein
MAHRFGRAILALCLSTASAGATEPNDSFAEATSLSPGQLSVADELTLGVANHPDTLLGVTNLFGVVYATDDDGSPLGDGHASGLGGVPTNSGSIDFLITGYGDDSFDGSHNEIGGYEVFVDVYDFFDDLVDSFSETRTLAAGVVDSFSYSDFEWIGGSYDVYIDNTLGPLPPSDVDFFRFTGLTSGGQFTAKTTGTGIDTLLGWFSGAGVLLESDDDDGGGGLSLIEGIVPSDGTLILAVTGYGDDSFVGVHSQHGAFELLLELDSATLSGDYNNDGSVDAADYTVWRNAMSGIGSLENETASLGTVDGEDYAAWKTNFGTVGTPGGAELTSVPEPHSTLLVLIAVAASTLPRFRSTIGSGC